MFRPSTAIAVHEEESEVNPLREAVIAVRGPEDFEDQAVLASSVQRRQLFVQEQVTLSNAVVVAELGRVLQDSQVRNDEKLLEIAQYTHDHVISAAADTENRLGCRIRDYLDAIGAHHEASVKEQIERQALDVDKRINSIVQDVHERVHASAADAVGSLANDLEDQINSRLSSMDTTINARATTHAVACEERLQTALKQVQDDFEAAADLQSDWIEKRLNAKLDAARKAAEAEQETNVRACEILYEEKAKEIDKKNAELAQLHAGMIEQRLQMKLDEALQSCQRQAQHHIDTRFVESMVQLEQTQQAAQGQLAATMIANVSSVEKKLQHQLRESQAISAEKIHRLGQELREVKQAAAEDKVRFSERISKLESRSKLLRGGTTRRDAAAILQAPLCASNDLSRHNNGVIDSAKTESATSAMDKPVHNRALPAPSSERQASEANQADLLTEATPGERTEVLAALAQLNNGIAQLLANAEPARAVKKPAISKPASFHDEKSFSRRHRQSVRESKDRGRNTNQDKEAGIRDVAALAQARAAATKQVEQRVLQRERELRSTTMRSVPRSSK